jgi:hypothetical protein
VYFTSKGDHSVHGIDIAAQKYTLLWKGDPDGLGVEGAVLSHVDNITVDAGSGDLFVAEDGGNMELIIITPEGALAPFVRVVGEGHADSEMTGPVFNPSRDRLYFSSQRGPSVKTPSEIVAGAVAVPEGPQAGMTFEITGPFRGVMTTTDAAPPETEAPIASPVDTLVGAAPNTQDAEPVSDEDSGSGGDKSKLVVGVVVAAAAVGGVVAFRKRRIDEASGENTSGS